MFQNTRTLAQAFFRITVRPFFPLLQRIVQSFGLMRVALTVEGPHQRQPYLIRMMAPEETPEKLVSILKENGFYEERIALNEFGQVASLRRLCAEKRGRQYHVRLFSDGEIRGHYELTPEDNPLGHWKEKVFEDRKDAFLPWLSP